MIVESVVPILAASVFSVFKLEVVKTWVVFILCWLLSIVGVGASFLVLGSTISGYRLWGISIVIAVGMISLSYGQKYAKVESRISFTPVDFISYLIQGFLWPTTWPALAQAIGVSSSITGPTVPPASTTGEIVPHAVTFLFS
jgi:hypothetical protein